MEQRYLSLEEAPLSTEPLTAYGRLSDLKDEAADTNVQPGLTLSADASALMTLLQQEARSRRKDAQGSFVWSGAFVGIMLWLTNRSVADPSALIANLLLGFALMGAMGAGGCLRLYRRASRRKPLFLKALEQARDVKHVGLLIQALQVQSTPVRNLAKQALITLLPTLRASDAPLLGDSERAILLRLLSIPPNDPGYRDVMELFSQSAYQRELGLRVAILKALEQVGGAGELQVVERLARGLPTLKNSTFRFPKAIREAAKECLPYLRERADAQRASEQLLRASSTHALPEDTLLRPASAQSDAQPEQLLRAAEPF